MKALVLKSKENLIYDPSYPDAVPLDGEALVKIAYCGICRTDRKAYLQGQRDLTDGVILGHEITGYALGKKVAVHPGIFCNECDDCKDGHDEACEKMQIIGFHVDGGMCESIKVPLRNLIPLGDHRDLSIAALTEPLGCAIHQFKMMEMTTNEPRILIIGCGALGILSAMYLRREGYDVKVHDIDPQKLAFARALGFDVHTNEMHYDVVIPCTPTSDGFLTAIDLVKKGGKIGFFSGLTSAHIDVKRLNEIHYKQLRVTGSYGCSLDDCVKAASSLETLGISRSMITYTELENAPKIISQMETPNLFSQISF
jgi:L-iditol 2-dehydrogenase